MNKTEFLKLASAPAATLDVVIPADPAHGLTEPMTMRVKRMTAGEREAWESLAFVDGVTAKNYRPLLLQSTVIDDTGSPLFGLADLDHIAAVPAPVVCRLFDAARKFNGIGSDIEEDAKNS